MRNRQSNKLKTVNGKDMYPQYWTPSIGGIFMKYSYEYKKKCVELYRQGKWPETPEGVNEKRFHDTIRIWVRTEDACGPEAFRHKNQNKVWATEEKYELIAKILAGASCKETAISAGISDGLLYQWVRCYKMKGYQGLAANAQPFYVLIDNEGKPLNKSYSYDEDIPKYIEFLQTGLENYKKEK